MSYCLSHKKPKQQMNDCISRSIIEGKDKEIPGSERNFDMENQDDSIEK